MIERRVCEAVGGFEPDETNVVSLDAVQIHSESLTGSEPRSRPIFLQQ